MKPKYFVYGRQFILLSVGVTAAFLLLFLFFMSNRGLRGAVVVALVAGLGICLATWGGAFLLINLTLQREKSRLVDRAGQAFRNYIDNDPEPDKAFPPELSGLAPYAVELRAELQRREESLRQDAERKSDMIAYLAHDLKTPLTSVIGYLHLLDDAPDMPAAQRAKFVGITLEKAERLEGLINEFFDIARYNLQQIRLEKEPIDLSYMLLQMSDEFYPLLTAHGNRVALSAPDKLTLVADPDRLARVFNNLLKNAIAYSYPNTPIRVSAAATPQGVTVRFENEGKTIPPGELENVFEKFYRLDAARSSNTGGAGLGLAIAKEIVRLHGGAITATSADERTVFTVTLPNPPENPE